MSKIRYEIFGNDAEILEFTSDDESRLELLFSEKYEGLLSIDGIAARVSEGKCSFDMRLIDAGCFTPVLITKNKVIKLPEIKKSGKRVSLSECSDDYTRSISLRERRLSSRVAALEKELGLILSRLNTTTIF